MRLYLKLKEQPKLPTEQKFVYAVLKHLAAAEVAASIYFTALNPSRDAIQNQFSHPGNNKVIFNQIGILAQLIVGACEKGWRGKSEKEIKKAGLESAKKIFPPFNEKSLHDALDKWLKDQSLKIDTHLKSPMLIADLSAIQTTLITCFPALDRGVLDTALAIMNQEIIRLKSDADFGADFDADWVVAENDTGFNFKGNGFFESKPADQPVATQTKSICTIC